MKLSPITRENVIEAGLFIDREGIPIGFIDNNYWVQLPNGKEYPFKYLTRIAYQLTPGNQEKWLKFESNKGYRKYMKDTLDFPVIYYPEGLNFITIHEIEHFEKIGGRRYRKDNPDDVKAGELLRPTVKKMNLWAKLSQVEDFVYKLDSHWQWSGTIKKYLWIKLFREHDSKKVYFTLEMWNDGNLYIGLNCQFSNHTEGTTVALSDKKVNQFYEYLESSAYQIKTIKKEQITQYNWNRLIEETQNYIYEYAALYDELEKLISDEKAAKKYKASKFSLIETDAPDKTKSYLTAKKTFKGRNTDWSKKQTTSNSLGRQGEELVIVNEKQKLKDWGLEDKIELVQKQLDGKGYDILSFDKEGREIHIEVKTTSNNKDEPFYMSANEVAYFKENPKNYFIYRLFNYHFPTRSAKFYMLTAKQLEKSTFNPINYEVVL